MFAIEVDYIDLDKIYRTVQGVRWVKIRKGKYIIQNKDKIVCVEQNRNWLKMSCNEEDFWNIWYYYFDIQYDYQNASFKMSNNKTFKKAQIVSKGLRILNQDIFEGIVTNLLLENYSRKDTKYLLNNICMICSKKRKNRVDGNEIIWYEFPDYKEILNNADKISLLKMEDGYEELMSVCMFVENGTFKFNLSYKDMMKQLKEFGIMSAKTANMICLYAFNMKEAFPKDNIVEESMYINKIDMSDFDAIKDIRGLANRYMLYYDKNAKKFAKSYLQMAKEVL